MRLRLRSAVWVRPRAGFTRLAVRRNSGPEGYPDAVAGAGPEGEDGLSKSLSFIYIITHTRPSKPLMRNARSVATRAQPEPADTHHTTTPYHNTGLGGGALTARLLQPPLLQPPSTKYGSPSFSPVLGIKPNAHIWISPPWCHSSPPGVTGS